MLKMDHRLFCLGFLSNLIFLPLGGMIDLKSLSLASLQGLAVFLYTTFVIPLKNSRTNLIFAFTIRNKKQESVVALPAVF